MCGIERPNKRTLASQPNTLSACGTQRQLGASIDNDDTTALLTLAHIYPATVQPSFEFFAITPQDIPRNDTLYRNVAETFNHDGIVPDFNDASAVFQDISDLSGLVAPMVPQQELAMLPSSGYTYQSMGLGPYSASSGSNLSVLASPGIMQPQSNTIGEPTRMERPQAGKPPQGGRKEGNRIQCTRPGCTTTFGRGAELRRHLKTVHRRGQTVPFRCMVCEHESYREDKVREHMEKMHGLVVTKKREGRSADAGYDEL